MPTLNQITQIPDGLLQLDDCTQIQKILKQPTLLHLQGEQSRPLFISVLLHGNEDTGFQAVQQLLRKYENRELPRSLSIFFGNVEAATAGVRRLDGQPDYNRVWPGTDHPECDETRLMQSVVDEMLLRKPFASIDVHNNTGKNPHYGCINSLMPQFLHLAAFFSRTVVFFETPKGVQSMAMAGLCPSVTIECGLPHLPHGVKHAADFLDTVLHLEEIKHTAVIHSEVDVYQTIARVTVPENHSFSFTDPDADILFDTSLENLNFSELTQPTVFARIQNNSDAYLQAWDDHEKDVSKHYFVRKKGKIILKRPVMPAMLTLDEKIIRQDCLCYLMQRLELPD